MTLAACGTGGAVADAKQACVYVHRALNLENQSASPSITASTRLNLENRAIAELVRATPYAARATSIDGSWNPLMTTIGEAQRVSIVNLAASLTRLCKVANSSTPYL
ncbi:MAG: hypothetical protein KGJ10_01520 [Acidobacteriota bacterium]|nr:hypothetical protein [Acidobacteriota bacterium]MDE3043489.1 hypothetical protein [Acidobacteriota bacterium]MDE3106808.1 hypothetical protein [Acidobacteriota bacterium]MDE3223493.1 hypothetical protein [Acidobacteriota bacterium]